MKKFVFIITIIMYIFVSCVYPLGVSAQKSGNADDTKTEDVYVPSGEHLLLADISSNFFLYEKNADKAIEPSGFAKILTAITVIENTDDIYKKVTVEDDIFEGYNYSNRSIGLKYGEEISVYDMLRAMLVYDAGDCAIALAHSVGKSYENFVDLMNGTAKKAGAKNSVFKHPAGFKTEGQKTTLKDLYYITKYALRDKTIAEIVDMDYIEIEPTNLHESKRVLFNTNEFMNTYYSLEYYNPNVHGVKSYVNNAENSGVIAKYTDSVNDLLILCAKAPTIEGNNMAYEDVNHLIKYATENFTPVTVIENDRFMSEVKITNGKNMSSLLLVNDGKIRVMLPNDYDKDSVKIDLEVKEKIMAPIKKGEVMGKAIVYYNDKKCGEVDLLAYSDVERSILTHLKNKITDFTDSAVFKLIIAVIIIVFILTTVNKYKQYKKKNNN